MISSAVLLAILLIIGIISSSWGAMMAYVSLEGNWTFVVYGCTWFYADLCSLSSGLVTLYLEMFGDNYQMFLARFFLHLHFVFCWISIVIGYAMLTSLFYLAYTHSVVSHVFIVLSIIPIVAWLELRLVHIVRITELLILMSIVSSVWLCLLVENYWGVAAALAMALNSVSILYPYKEKLLGLTPSENYFVGSAFASPLMAMAIKQMISTPTLIESLFDFYGRSAK